MKVVFTTKEELGLTLLTRVNNTDIYGLEVDGCTRRLLVPDGISYLGIVKKETQRGVLKFFKMDEPIYFVKLNGGAHDQRTQKAIIQKYSKRDTIVDSKKDKKIEGVEVTGIEKCPELFDLNLADNIVKDMNKKIQEHCSGFENLRSDSVVNSKIYEGSKILSKFTMHLEYLFRLEKESKVVTYKSPDFFELQGSPNELLLCIKNEQQECISSIVIARSVYNNETCISVDSRTHASYEGRGFNKLLRAAAIVIAPLLDPSIRTVVSYAENAISLRLMVTLFGGKVLELYEDGQKKYYEAEDINRFIELSRQHGVTTFSNANLDHMSREDKTFYDKMFTNAFIIDVDISNKNIIENANQVFETTLIEQGCSSGRKKERDTEVSRDTKRRRTRIGGRRRRKNSATKKRY